jgi:hypothetical protein
MTSSLALRARNGAEERGKEIWRRRENGERTSGKSNSGELCRWQDLQTKIKMSVDIYYVVSYYTKLLM